MAIEITPRIQVKEIFWPTVFLAASIIIALLLGASYLYFEISSKKISQDIQKKERALVNSPAERALEAEVLLHESKIKTFKNLLLGHEKTLNVFSFLEEVSHPGLWFSDFNFNSSSKTVNVSGRADSFVALGQQLFILKEVEVLKQVDLSEISMSEEGGVDFALLLTLDPQIFK